MRRWRMKRIAIVAVAGIVALLAGAYGVFAILSGGGEDPVSIADVPAGSGSTGPGATTFDGPE